MTAEVPLVLVSNRGPATFQDGQPRRGGGGLVTALQGFIQHYLWDLSNAPDIRRHEVVAYEQGYCTVNEDLARAVLEEVEGHDDAVVMLHDYHLYVAPKFIRRERPDLFLHHFVH